MDPKNEAQWSDFGIPDIFSFIQRGKRLKNADHVPGTIPYVSSTATNNGVDDYISEIEGTRSFEDCISLANSGSVGAAFYEPFRFVASDHVTCLKEDGLSRFVYLFLATSLAKQGCNFNFNREINDCRIRRMRVMLPAASSCEPDYGFMEEYVRERETELLDRYARYARARIAECELFMKGDFRISVNDREWGEFRIGDIFTVDRSSPRNKDDYTTGDYPFVSSGAMNNGVIKLCSLLNNETVDRGNCITVSPVDGSSFYQPVDFLGRGGAGSSILILRSPCINQYTGKFLARSIQHTCSKYTYGRMGNKDGIVREVILLPVNDSGEPDYEFMEEYVREREQHAKGLSGACAEQSLTDDPAPSLQGIAWKPFDIISLFDTMAPGKGHGLTHLTKVEHGGISYIGATNRNNGALCYVAEDDCSKGLVQEGNCIGFIKNGDGSAGYAIYKAEPFISTSDVVYGYASWLNRWTGLFFVVAQDMIQSKYSHGYKRTLGHLSGDKVMLPVNISGKPDYEFMERYARNLMAKKYRQYLDFIRYRNRETRRNRVRGRIGWKHENIKALTDLICWTNDGYRF